MNAELIRALDQLEKGKRNREGSLIEAIEAALVSAYKKDFGTSQDVRISIDRDTGEGKCLRSKRSRQNQWMITARYRWKMH